LLSDGFFAPGVMASLGFLMLPVFFFEVQNEKETPDFLAE